MHILPAGPIQYVPIYMVAGCLVQLCLTVILQPFNKREQEGARNREIIIGGSIQEFESGRDNHTRRERVEKKKSDERGIGVFIVNRG